MHNVIHLRCTPSVVEAAHDAQSFAKIELEVHIEQEVIEVPVYTSVYPRFHLYHKVLFHFIQFWRFHEDQLFWSKKSSQ